MDSTCGIRRGIATHALPGIRTVSSVWWLWPLGVLAVLLVLWLAALALLVAGGRRDDARVLAGFVPDCVVLVARLIRDPRLPRRHRLLLVGVAGYLALPFDLIPDFLPVIGHLDDALVVALALRLLVRGGGEPLIREHWRGPERSLALLLRL